MIIEPIQSHQWPIFFAMIRQQGWHMSCAEQQLYTSGLDHPFLCLHHQQRILGFISGCCHNSQAWIGNLIVAEPQRGNGNGALLFDTLIIHLKQRGVTTLWLTASEEGRHLYQKRGFVACDTIQRWITSGLGLAQGGADHRHYLHQLDHQKHHQQRTSFLHTLGHNGKVVRSGHNVALLQPSSTFSSLGPWYEHGNHAPHQYDLLMKARAVCSRHHQLVTDIYASSQLQGVLTSAGFKRCATTTLMYYGPSQPDKTIAQHALAGLGSFN